MARCSRLVLHGLAAGAAVLLSGCLTGASAEGDSTNSGGDPAAQDVAVDSVAAPDSATDAGQTPDSQVAGADAVDSAAPEIAQADVAPADVGATDVAADGGKADVVADTGAVVDAAPDSGPGDVATAGKTTCAGACGKFFGDKADGYCNCDFSCASYGDCCADLKTVCSAEFAGTCAGTTCKGAGTLAGGKSALCSCAADCVKNSNCCKDQATACAAPADAGPTDIGKDSAETAGGDATSETKETVGETQDAVASDVQDAGASDVAPEVADSGTPDASVDAGTFVPTPCSKLTFDGICNANVVEWCDSGTYKSQKCAATGKVCAIDAVSKQANCYAQDPTAPWPSTVTLLTLDATGKASATGDLSKGKPVDVSFMVNDNVNCADGSDITGSNAKLFTGNQQWYALSKPVGGWTETTVKVTSTKAGNPRVYLMALPKGIHVVPPDVFGASYCVARADSAFAASNVTTGWRNFNDGEYEIFLGVAGGQFDKNFATSTYTIEVSSQPLAKKCYDKRYDDNASDTNFLPKPTRYPDWVQAIAVDANGKAQVQHKLDTGYPVCELTWAASSQVACFPATQASLFAGNTRFYRVAMPKAGYTMVRVTPDPGVDVSLYTIQQGNTSTQVPPEVTGAVACDNSPPKNFNTVGGPGQPESTLVVSTGNPYTILIAVTSPAGVKGGYTLDIDQKLAASDTCGDLWSQAKPDKFPTAATQWYPAVNVLAPDATGVAKATGSTVGGMKLCSLAFAWQSNVTCFPQTQAAHFAGKQQFYAVKDGVGPGEKITVTVTPKKANVDVSLYGYWMSAGSFYVPPKVPSVGNCEASHSKTLSGAGNPGAAEWIYFENPGGNTYNYFFAVASPDNAAVEGDYDIVVQRIKPPPPFCPESLPGATYTAWPQTVAVLGVDAKTEFATIAGDIAGGSCVNLGFANSSQTACFPATQNANFQGKQVFARLKEPMPPNSVLDIVLKPKGNVDLNLYGYMLGTNNIRLPPNVPSALACEASYSTKTGGNPGAQEKLHFENPSDKNSYQVLIAISGANGVVTGTFDLEATLKVAKPFCPESLPGQTFSSWPTQVQKLTEDANGNATSTDSVEKGACVNLGFAAQSSTACFPETEFDNFMGPQRFYALAKPMAAGDIIDVVITPDPDVDVSVYGYLSGTTNFPVPPLVNSVPVCEASYDKKASWNPGMPETLHFENPTGNAYNLFFAVSGTAYSKVGAYKVEVFRKKAPPPFCPESLPGAPQSSWPASVTKVKLVGGSAQVTGDLATGACSNLAFAANSQVACFPATQNASFQGNLKYYALEAPLPAGSVASIEVTPSSGTLDVNLFGYLMGTTSFMVPPYVPSTGPCEAGNNSGIANPGMPEWITFHNPTGNSYNLFFAVGAPTGVKAGAYTVKVKVIEPGPPFCAESLPGPAAGTAWPSSVTVLDASSGKATGSGNLSSGKCSNLDFAWDSVNACFPATLSNDFQGNQVFYALKAPVPGNKTVTIEVTPGAGVNAQVYAYRQGTTSFYVPPNLPSALTCEYANFAAAGAKETLKLGASASSTSSYNVFFAVSGAAGAASGAFSYSVVIQ